MDISRIVLENAKYLPIKPDPIPDVDFKKFMDELKKLGLDKCLVYINDKTESRTLGESKE